MFRAAAVFLHRSPSGAAYEVRRSSGPWWGRGPCTWRQTPAELGTSRQFSICGPVGWPSSFPLGGLALPCSIIVLTSTQVLPTDGANCRVPIWGGAFHCRCERTQIQWAQYNEFGREAGLRTGPLWGLRQRSGRILGEQDRQRRSLGDGQSPSSGLVRGWILLLLFWYSTNRTSWCLPNCRPLLREISLVIYILLLSSSWLSICQLRRSPLECLSHPTLPSTCCELQWAAWRCSGITPSLMRPDCQLRAFNLEVTGSCTIALSPCSHSCPSTLVSSFGGWRGWLRWIAYCPFFSGHQLPRTRCSSAIFPSSCGPSLVILGHFSPRLGPWA